MSPDARKRKNQKKKLKQKQKKAYASNSNEVDRTLDSADSKPADATQLNNEGELLEDEAPENTKSQGELEVTTGEASISGGISLTTDKPVIENENSNLLFENSGNFQNIEDTSTANQSIPSAPLVVNDDHNGLFENDSTQLEKMPWEESVLESPAKNHQNKQVTTVFDDDSEINMNGTCAISKSNNAKKEESVHENEQRLGNFVPDMNSSEVKGIPMNVESHEIIGSDQTEQQEKVAAVDDLFGNVSTELPWETDGEHFNHESEPTTAKSDPLMSNSEQDPLPGTVNMTTATTQKETSDKDNVSSVYDTQKVSGAINEKAEIANELYLPVFEAELGNEHREYQNMDSLFDDNESLVSETEEITNHSSLNENLTETISHEVNEINETSELFGSQDDEIEADLPWKQKATEVKHTPESTVEEPAKFSFLEDDDDLLDDDDSFLASDEELERPDEQSPAFKSEGAFVDLPRSIADVDYTSSSNTMHQNPYIPSRSSTSSNFIAEGSTRNMIPVDQSRFVNNAGPVGFVKPKFITNSSQNFQSSYKEVDELQRKLDQEKHKTNAYDFPLDLVKQDSLKRGKPVHISSPVQSFRRTSVSSISTDKSLGNLSVRPISVSSSQSKPFYAELPIPEIDHTRAAPVRVASRNMYPQQPLSPTQPKLAAAFSRKTSNEPRLNPYAPKMPNTTGMQHNNYTASQGTASHNIPLGTSNIPFSPKNRTSGVLSPVQNKIVSNSYAAVPSFVIEANGKTSSYAPKSQPLRNRGYSNTSAGSSGSLRGFPPMTNPQKNQILPVKDSKNFNFPSQPNLVTQPVTLDRLSTTSTHPNVPSVISPTTTSRKTHARSNSSIYAPANHAHSSKYAPTVQPQFQQQNSGIIPHSMESQNYGPSIFSAHAGVPAVPISQYSRGESVNLNASYIKNRQFPIFHWSRSSKVVFAIPSNQAYMSEIGSKTQEIIVSSYESITKVDSNLEDFPGPLIRGKTKHKEVEKWIEDYLTKLEHTVEKSDYSTLWEILKLKLIPGFSFKAMANLLYNPSNLLSYLSQPFMTKNTGYNAYKLDSTTLTRILGLLQNGLHDEALQLSLSQKDYAMSLLLGSILGKDKWSVVVDKYLTEEFDQKTERDNFSINLLALIFQVFVGNSKKVIDSFSFDANKFNWALGNWTIIISSVLNNCEAISANGVLSPLVVEFLIQFGEFLVRNGSIIPGSIALVIADVPLTDGNILPNSSVKFQSIGCANAFGSLLLSEVYEFGYKSQDASFPGFPCLIAQKMVHAAALSEFGLNSAATKYLDTIHNAMKLLPKNAEVVATLMRYMEDLNNQLSSNSVGWLGKPKLSSVWGQLDKSFNKFIGGDTDIDEPGPGAPEGKVFENFTPSSSRNPSMVDLSQASTYFTPGLPRPPHSHSKINASSNVSSSTPKSHTLRENSYPQSVVRNKIATIRPTDHHSKSLSKLPVTSQEHPSLDSLSTDYIPDGESHSNNQNRLLHASKHRNIYKTRSNDLVTVNDPTSSLMNLSNISRQHSRTSSINSTVSGSSSANVSIEQNIYGQPTNQQLSSLGSPKINKTVSHANHSIGNTEPLETLFDDTMIHFAASESSTIGKTVEHKETNFEHLASADDIVKEIENEIDAEIEDLESSEFTDDSVSHKLKDEAIEADSKPPPPECALENEPITKNDNIMAPLNMSHHASTDNRTGSVISAVGIQEPSSNPSAIKEGRTLSSPITPANPYAPNFRQNSTVRKSRTAYNPYSPHSGSTRSSTVSDMYNPDEKPASLDTSTQLDNLNEDLNMYAYGGYKLSEKGTEQDDELASDPRLSPATKQTNINHVSQNHSPTDPSQSSEKISYFNSRVQYNDETEDKLPITIKDPVIRPIQNINFAPFIPVESSNEEYYDDIVEDTDEEEAEEITSSGEKEQINQTEGDRRTAENHFEEHKLKGAKSSDDEKNSNEDDEEDEDDKQHSNEKKHSHSGGSWLGWFKKESNEKKPIKAKLGNKNNFYYDENLKRWVNKDATEEEKVKVSTPPPPPPVVKRKLSKTPEIKPRQGSIAGGPALRTAHAVMPTNPLTGKPLDPIRDLSDSLTSKEEMDSATFVATPKPSVSLSGAKANGLDDLMALTAAPGTASSTRRKKKNTRGYVNVMNNL